MRDIDELDRTMGVRGTLEPHVAEDGETLDPKYRVVHIEVPASGSDTVNMCSLAEALVGEPYMFICTKDGGGTGVILQDQDDAITSGLNYVTAGNGFTAKGDTVIAIPTPYAWEIVKSHLT